MEKHPGIIMMDDQTKANGHDMESGVINRVWSLSVFRIQATNKDNQV